MKHKIYQLIWAKIESEFEQLPKIKTVYYAPTELLHLIPFVGIGNESGVLGKRYQMIQLSTVGKLIHGLSEPDWNTTVLYGGIEYQLDTSVFTDSIQKNDVNADFTKTDYIWSYLPGTESEIRTIQKILIKKDKNVQVYSSSIATENAIKSMSGHSPAVLHLATHGFFYSESDEKKNNVFSESKDPLLRSGLILAGANHAWVNGMNPYQTEDGILTAAEISVLDLSNTDLVVLSACETGLGDITKTEGVYGLQRAFKMAGVDIIIMSLWQVPDQETAEFMSLFYSKWSKGMGVRESFRYAQNKMYKKYPNDPNKWAGFILLE